MAKSEEKAALRTRYRRERNARYIEHSFEFLATTKELEGATVIASYRSYGVEPDTKALNQKLISHGKTLLLPRMAGDAIEWIHWNGDESAFTQKQNIEEPIGNSFDNLDSIEVIIVPSLRIDRNGYRLGQGGGYYDRALAKTNAFTIGLIHPDEISSADLPREPWDIPLRAAATPDLVMRFSKN